MWSAGLALVAVLVGCGDEGAPTPPGEPPLPPEGGFTLAVLPDTQFYARDYPEIFEAQTRFLAAQATRRHIAMVLHEGDVTDDDSDAQWTVARRALGELDSAVPTAIALGNHDLGVGGTAADRTTRFHDFFPVGQIRSQPTFVESFAADRTDNAVYVFDAAGRQWLVLVLEFGPRDEVVDWANGVLDRYPSRRVIVLTHAFLYADDSRYDHVARPDQMWNPHDYGVAGGSGGANDAEELWQMLLRHRDQVDLVLSGHVLLDGVGHLETATDGGHPVHQLLANFQQDELGGGGFLRLLVFGPDGRTIDVYTYSPFLGLAGDEPEHRFTIVLGE